MDLVSVTPEFNLYDRNWVIRTKVTQQPPAKFVFAQEGRRMGLAVDSVVSAGCIISGGRVMHSVLSPGVRVNSYCEVEYSILMPGVEVGRYGQAPSRKSRLSWYETRHRRCLLPRRAATAPHRAGWNGSNCRLPRTHR